MAEPPSEAGGDQARETCPFPTPVTMRPVGAPGTVALTVKVVEVDAAGTETEVAVTV